MTKEERINLNKGDEFVTMGGTTTFNSNLRAPFDPSAQLLVGDVLVFPETITAEIMGTRRFNGNTYQFMVVEVIKADGTKTAINWFPSSFIRATFEYKMDGDSAVMTGNIFEPKGTAIDLFKQNRGKAEYDDKNNLVESDTQKCVEALLGKKVKVANRTKVDTVGFVNNMRDTSKLVPAFVLTYDLAE